MMQERNYCVVSADAFYRIFVAVQTGQGEDSEVTETVLGYKLAEGERLIDALPPLIKNHAGGAGYVKPRWDEDAKTWCEGATPEEITAWEAEHPAPPAPPPSRVEVLEAEVTRLRAQNELQAQHQTFLEDCLLEMGNIVYA